MSALNPLFDSTNAHPLKSLPLHALPTARAIARYFVDVFTRAIPAFSLASAAFPLGAIPFRLAATSSYAEGFPPPPMPFKIPPEALDPHTPLLSIMASGQFAKQYIFKVQHIAWGPSKKRRRLQQIIQPYHVQRDFLTECRKFARTAFSDAYHAWFALTPNEQAPFIKHVNHYGLVMQPLNLFMKQFMKARYARPENTCKNTTRPDRRHLRRNPGRT